MNTHRKLRNHLICLAAALCAGAAGAQTASASARYEVERARCLMGQTAQDTSTCLREAAAARDQSRRGMVDESATELEANRLLRCDPLPADQKRDCIARMHGEGTTSGSVEGGGIYRELTTTVYGDAPMGTPPDSLVQPAVPVPMPMERPR